MKINKVALLNFRNHTNTVVDFTSGINLILGRNGAGKSSILEAIGLALYNSETRTKLDEALNLESGASYAIVRVDFTASDGTDYLAERRIGSQPYHRLFAEGESSARISSTNDVVKKIMELTGIDGNVKNIYKNLISCYQNQITQIFTEIESKRKLLFDKIFNTDIYERMAQGDGLKALEDRYSAEIRDNEIKKDEKSLLLKDDSDLEIKSKDLNNKLAVEKEKLSVITTKISELKILKEKLDATKNTIDTIEIKSAGLEKQLTDRQRQLGQVNDDIMIAIEAQKIIDENHTAFTEYNRLKSRLDTIETDIAILEKDEKEKQKKENDFEKLVNLEIKLTTEKENSEKAIREIIQNIEKQEQEIGNRNEELSFTNATLQSLKTEKEKIEILLGEFNPLYHEYNAVTEKISEYQNLHKGIESQLPDLSGIDEKLHELIQQKEILIKDRKAADELLSEIKALETRLKDNESAANKLKNGICPFLKEGCLNIREGGSSLDYFGHKKQELTVEQDTIKNQLAQFTGLDEKIKDIEKNLNLIDEWKTRNENTKKQLAELKTSIELELKDKEIAELKLKAAIRNFDESLTNAAFEEASRKINTKLNSVNTEYESNYKVHSAKKSEMERLKSALKKSQDKLAETEGIIITTNEKLTNIIGKKQDISDIINEFNKRLSGFDELKANRNTLKIRLDELSGPYNLYTANLNKAGEIDKLKDRAENITKEIGKINQDIKVNKEQLAILKDGFNPELFDLIKGRIEESEKQATTMTVSIANIETAIRIVKSEIDQNLRLKNIIEELGKVIRHLDKKKELTSIFRKNLRDMGKIVASRLIERIETVATANYRNISGKGEQIKWLNNEKDTYAVYLDDTRNRRRFEMLSGGEQVSVALSLRAAMASLMTKANFTIFDEPTINLDVERKAALAESLNKILNNLEQAIIVTHDDSFREMAGKIIEL